jgi:hypothetical protein
VRLTIWYEEGPGRRSVARQERVFVAPVTDEARLLEAVEQLVPDKPDGSGAGGVSALEIALEDLQDATGSHALWAMEQLSFLPTGPAEAGDDKLRPVQRYLAARFGASCLRRAIVLHPHAPLAEWRVGLAEIEDE